MLRMSLRAGRFHMPTANGIRPIYGHSAHAPPPANVSRAKDKVDMAYYRLAPDLRDDLAPSLKPAGIDHLLLSDDLEDGDLFTFAGYPWRSQNDPRIRR